MVMQIVDLAHDKAEIERQREDDEKSEDDLFDLNGLSPVIWLRIVSVEGAMSY